MGSITRKVYCADSAIISSLGTTTQANRLAIEAYTTVMNRYGDGTPVCLIERSELLTKGLEKFTFAEQIAIRVLEDVIANSGVMLSDTRSLLVLSTTKGNITCLTHDFERSYLGTLATQIADYFQAAHTPLIVSNACVSGVEAVLVGARLIEQGRYDHVFVVGVDVMSEFVVTGFNSFKSISPTICRPYDASRDGLTLGEAAAALLLTADTAFANVSKKCESPPLPSITGEPLSTAPVDSPHVARVVIAGGGMSNDANHISGPSRTGDGLVLAIEAALNEAKLFPKEISFVNTHGTGTPFNDEMESKALHQTGLVDVPCNSLKPYLGHTLGASGVVEIILSVEQLKQNCIYGTKGYTDNGVPFALNIKASHRQEKLTNALKTASGFGGTNAAIVLSKELTTDVTFAPPSSVVLSDENALSEGLEKTNHLDIIELAAVMITKSNLPFGDFIRQAYKELGQVNLKFFKMDDLCKLGYVASCQLMKGVELPCAKERIGVVLASKSGSLHTDLYHQQIVNERLPEGTSPAIFVYTLANIVAAEIAIHHKFKGELMLFIQDTKEMKTLSDYSQQLIFSGRCDAVLYGWCDLLGEEYDADLKLISRK